MSRMDPRELRRELSEHEGGVGRRYPAALKQQATEYASERHAAGARFITIAQELGIPTSTLVRWCDGTTTQPSATALVPVEVISPSSSSITLVSPSGFRLEGLELDDAIAAMRALR